jgi:endonuclease/exonuclease/phosphatase family metal-dependent hydrolase
VQVDPVRVMTWNIWGRHGSWKQRERSIIDTLRTANADIIGLQEVWVGSTGRTQAEVLAQLLEFDFHFSATEMSGNVGIGNAILTRWPIKMEGQTMLSTSQESRETRKAVHAYIMSLYSMIPVVTTHLSWQRNGSHVRQVQISELQNILGGMTQTEWPPILVGDFNADPSSYEIRSLTGRCSIDPGYFVFEDAWEQGGDGAPGFTWTPDNSHFRGGRGRELMAMPLLRRRIDYIFIGLPDGRPQHVLPVQIGRAWLVGKYAAGRFEGSDHYAAVADCLPTYVT